MPTTNGSQSLSYRNKRSSYSIQNRINFREVVESDAAKISVKDYAEKYHYSPIYVARLCRSGLLKAIKSRKKWLVLDVPIKS